MVFALAGTLRAEKLPVGEKVENDKVNDLLMELYLFFKGSFRALYCILLRLIL